AGAAIGTASANVLAAIVFLWIFASGRRDVKLRLGGKQFDLGIIKEIVRVATPLAGTRLSRTFGRFPFLFVLSILGAEVVAAYAIGRRIILLALMPAWGFSTASSTLVGQAIGAGDDEEAMSYGWQTLRIAVVTQLLIAVGIVIFASPIASAFGTNTPSITVSFIRLFGFTVAAFSVSRVMRGGLRGAGDTSWPFYGGIIGTYLIRLPLAFAALPVGTILPIVGIGVGLGWGIYGIFAAIAGDMYARALVNLVRFNSGKWKQIARKTTDGPATGD
ncbi:MAG: MATE family efflux transporter, partial [Halobacteriaceae archaeon]